MHPDKLPDIAGRENAKLLEPIRADERYLKVQPLPTLLIRALAGQERVYVGGKPHRVKGTGISESGQIMGKLEPLEPAEPFLKVNGEAHARGGKQRDQDFLTAGEFILEATNRESPCSLVT